jgi:hypothetical protein
MPGTPCIIRCDGKSEVVKVLLIADTPHGYAIDPDQHFREVGRVKQGGTIDVSPDGKTRVKHRWTATCDAGVAYGNTKDKAIERMVELLGYYAVDEIVVTPPLFG